MGDTPAMRRTSRLLAAAAVAALALSPGLADARAGSGSSMGSRGTRTYTAPPTTPTAPFAAQPFERSLTPRPAPQPGFGAPSPGVAQPGFAQPYARRGAFTSGLLGGLIGAGLGGMLLGHGFFGGLGDGGSFLGFLLQIGLLFLVARFLFRRFAGGQPAFAGMGAGMGNFARRMTPGNGGLASGGGRPAPAAVPITPADYQTFEQLLLNVQAAWTARDINALRGMATPEMVEYFAEQLAEHASRHVRNTVTDVRLQKGDLAEAWREGSREYATVAMRFSMIDVTRTDDGRVVDGSPAEHQAATELWTFLRAPGGQWVLSAIQQAR